MDLFPRSVSEMPHPLPSPSSSSSSVQEKQQQHTQKKGSNSGQSLSLQHVDDGYTVWRCHDKALSELMRDALNNLAQSFQGNNNSSGSNSGKGSIGKKKQKNTRDGRKRTGLDLAARLPEVLQQNPEIPFHALLFTADLFEGDADFFVITVHHNHQHFQKKTAVVVRSFVATRSQWTRRRSCCAFQTHLGAWAGSAALVCTMPPVSSTTTASRT